MKTKTQLEKLEEYRSICKCWYSYPNNVPIFENWFFEDNFVVNNTLKIEEAEACRQQLIAIREGLG